MDSELYPYVFEPVYQEYLWGGDRIARQYGRSGVPAVCAESWEISDRPEARSRIVNGPCRDRTLRDLLARHSAAVLGTSAGSATAFPLLIKIIDARLRLSLQVHPDETTAAATGGEPKTEMWYALPSAPDARVFCGLRPGVNRAQFEAALREERLEPLLHAVPVAAGQAVFVPGGRVHAIAEGCLLLEIQQNSNTTFRVYDWGRLGADGKPRDLHVDAALRTINWSDSPGESLFPRAIPAAGPNRRYEIVTAPCFRVGCLDLIEPETLTLDGRSFLALFVASGSAIAHGNGQEAVLRAGTSCLLPATLGTCSLIPADAGAEVVLVAL